MRKGILAARLLSCIRSVEEKLEAYLEKVGGRTELLYKEKEKKRNG